MIQITNLTPHAVNIYANGEILTLPKCDNPLRLDEISTACGDLYGIPIFAKGFARDKCKLPPYEEGHYYIVPLLIAQSFPSRIDLLVPNEMIRDEEGRVIGCRSLAYFKGE